MIYPSLHFKPHLLHKSRLRLRSRQTFQIVSTAKMRSTLIILLCFALLLSLFSPKVEAAAIRRIGNVKSYGGNKSRQGGRRIPVKGRTGRTGAAPPPDADVVTDESFGKEEGAVGAAGGLGELAGLCEVLMFDRGESNYSLKFIKNC